MNNNCNCLYEDPWRCGYPHKFECACPCHDEVKDGINQEINCLMLGCKLDYEIPVHTTDCPLLEKIYLSEGDMKKLLDVLDNPPMPNERLKKVFDEYKPDKNN